MPCSQHLTFAIASTAGYHSECHWGVSSQEIQTIPQRAATSAKKRAVPTGAERRAADRRPCRVEAICQVGTPGQGLHTPARIVDISVGGIGLILKERFEKGTQLTVQLQTTAINRPLPMKVVHVVEIASDFYLLGGAFTAPLSASDLHKLVP